MSIAIFLAVIFTVVLSVITCVNLKGFKLDTRRLTRIGVVTTLTLVLYMIKIVPFPQGGGCSLLSILPIMVLAVIAGKEEALICGIVVGLTKIVVAPPFFPLQIPLDYLGGMMAIAFTPIFGIDKKSKLFLGAIFASIISILFSIYSGIIFFGHFAPEGMNVWYYAAGYSLLGYGVEALASSIVLTLLPLNKFRELVKL
ncbi:thiamine transporter [Desulfonispora thiosulfatigenes DSM 11270]|uniref:Thiamine transporter n=1 Tax=Desulfonispora thiosulfatigenes DSM 11270 TaxID=656914 RepID=A0A1W1UCS8_DESTI|nr:energy-coupled thiamine transporter ThiT [Desulfonispora thiosulfatigenes]SMB78850.1 thiamine transporter [Desulfonispora thiosulfatigenes DSM 11270]